MDGHLIVLVNLDERKFDDYLDNTESITCVIFIAYLEKLITGKWINKY